MILRPKSPAPPRRVNGFDRVTLRLDAPLRTDALSSLTRHQVHYRLVPINVPFAHHWKYVLEVFQPSMQGILAILTALGNTVSYEISYVEVARDYITRFRIEAQRMQMHFARSAVLRYGPPRVTRCGPMVYIGVRKSPMTLATYADRPSKLSTAAHGRHCLHTEIRLTGTGKIRDEGLVTLADLAALDFDAFWERHITFWNVGSLTKLGHRMASTSNAGTTGVSMTDKAARTRAARALASPKFKTVIKASRRAQGDELPGPVAAMFALQTFVRQHPDVRRVMVQLTAAEWEEAARLDALDTRRMPSDSDVQDGLNNT